MTEKMGNPIDRIKGRSEMRTKIALAVREAVAQVALINSMGAKNAQTAMDAVSEALARDVSTNDSVELRRIAEEAAEKSFSSFGFDSPKVLADLYATVESFLHS
jgi:hypothetical protein